MEEHRIRKHHSQNIRFIAALPKTAGTFVGHVLSDYFGATYAHISDRRGCCEYDIYRPALIDHVRKPTVVHQHTLGTEGNVEYLKSYGIKPIVLVRNIFDIVVSFRDHLLRESLRWLFVEVEEEYRYLSKVEQYDFIIRFAVPWFVHFYVTWYKATTGKEGLESCWIRYEDMLQNEDEFFERIIKWLSSAPVNHERLNLLLRRNEKRYRYSVGKSGRGLGELNGEQRREIESMMSSYTNVDFAPLGL